ESAQLLLFRRRLRSPEDQPLHLAHGAVPDASATLAGWTTDRSEFVGRGGNVGAPVALTRGSDQLTRVTGCTLDPIFALAYELGIPANGSAELSFLTSTGLSAEEARANIERFRTAQGIGWSFQEAAAHTEAQFAAARLSPVDGPQIQQFWSALIRPHSGLDSRPLEIEPGYRRLLWSVGVSGDLPIALIKVENEEGTDALRTLIRIQHYLRKQLQEFDLIVLDEYAGGYTQPLRDRVRGFAERVGAAGWLNRSGGIFYLAGADLAAEVRAAINAHATFVGNAEEPLASQLARWNTPEPARLPPFEPIPSAPLASLTSAPVTRPADLLYDCGFGGFTADGREYVIHLEPGQQTPAPWSNVIANAQFGALVTESGSMCTWSGNSGERRLTTWNNDPVIDRSGEAIYLRDEETADIWSPTPRPCGIGPHQIRHGAGYTRFLHNSHALDQRVRVFVPVDLPVKVVEITLANTSDRQRRITLTYFAEWVLGSQRADTAADIVTRLALDAGAILARNPFSDSFGARTAFLAGSDPVHSATGDRIEFLRGPHGLARPAGLDRIGLGGRFGARLDPCAALQMHLDIGPHQTRTAYFL
ncbi:MAG TPA: hypothetical protein VK864_12835, partial [Longimicrobiales bacterium]|nr:hypothetical protein [Longimicrobiales bacterium]